jgi:hypothetical protein
MSAFEAYKEYLALKNHFSKPNYDYIKYNGKTGVKQSSFVNRKDKLFFEKLAKRPDYHDFLIANLSFNHKLWIKEIAYSDEADKRYLEWKKRNQSLTYLFKTEISKHLLQPFNDNFTCRNGEHPALMKIYLGGDICLETLCILLDLSGALKHWDSRMEYDPVWEELSLKVKKYIPFIKYDKEKYRKIILDLCAE